MAKETFRDGVIHPEFTGQTSSSQPLDETGAPFLSISVNPLYVKKKREKQKLLNDDLWWTCATLWFHTAYSFLTHWLLCKRQDNGQSSELLKPCPGGRDVLRPHLALVRYPSQNVKSSGREKLCAPPHSQGNAVLVSEAAPTVQCLPGPILYGFQVCGGDWVELAP